MGTENEPNIYRLGIKQPPENVATPPAGDPYSIERKAAIIHWHLESCASHAVARGTWTRGGIGRMQDANARTMANGWDHQVNIPKTRNTYCKGKECKKHTQHKVTQYKAGKVRGSDDGLGSVVDAR